MNDGIDSIRAHEAIWKKLHDEVAAVFNELSQQGIIGERDYFVVEDDWGWNIVQTELVISSLWPQIARRFQLILSDFPDWRITMQVLRNKADGWPGMGVIVSIDGFEDELKREFLPPAFRNMTF